jgi:hypothetical protein
MFSYTVYWLGIAREMLNRWNEDMVGELGGNGRNIRMVTKFVAVLDQALTQGMRILESIRMGHISSFTGSLSKVVGYSYVPGKAHH